MNFSEEQIDECEQMASLFFSPEDIAINLELTEEQSEAFVSAVTMRYTSHPLVAAYMKGWFSAEILLRKAIKQSSLNGSSPSQQLMIQYQNNNRR